MKSFFAPQNILNPKTMLLALTIELLEDAPYLFHLSYRLWLDDTFLMNNILGTSDHIPCNVWTRLRFCYTKASIICHCFWYTEKLRTSFSTPFCLILFWNAALLSYWNLRYLHTRQNQADSTIWGKSRLGILELMSTKHKRS